MWANVISLSVRLSQVEEADRQLSRAEKHFKKLKYGNLQLALLYDSFQMENEVRVNLNKFIEIASDDESILADAADDFFNADRADLAFILADSASKASSQYRRAGLI